MQVKTDSWHCNLAEIGGFKPHLYWLKTSVCKYFWYVFAGVMCKIFDKFFQPMFDILTLVSLYIMWQDAVTFSNGTVLACLLFLIFSTIYFISAVGRSMVYGGWEGQFNYLSKWIDLSKLFKFCGTIDVVGPDNLKHIKYD